jgi:hypothetical protein
MEEKNVFGQPLKDGQVVEPTPPAAAAADDKTKVAVDDIEKNPLVVELRKQIDDTKKNYGGNLIEQRNKIARLEEQIKGLNKKPEEKPKPLFEKIVRVKDLPKDERDAMTETERRLFDENADMKERLNEMHSTSQTKAGDDTKTGKDDDADTFDVTKAVQDEAMKLADGNYTKAQELIGKFNSLDFDLTKLTAENLAERLASVVALIPDFKPKNEQETGNGGAVKDGKATTGVDAAVAAAVAERQGNAGGNYVL